ncbi:MULTISPECIES: cytochrome b6-f complex subunit PetL [Prochlorococcus]
MGILFYLALVGLGLGAAFAMNKILKAVKLI